MKPTFLVTGGCGFVGSNIAIHLRDKHPRSRVVAFDNLRRRGSELNIPRLRKAGVEFVHGDVRERGDLEVMPPIDSLIDCAAEPSVLAGLEGSPQYVIQTNLMGTANCLELARKHKAKVIFLSTSRVYPKSRMEALAYVETKTRYRLSERQTVQGVSPLGIAEDFPLEGARTLYGASKLGSELLALEYYDTFGVGVIINRCGTIAGPWQMGKVDQGFLSLWVARHLWGKSIEYLGYGGTGKQVRDVLHVEDLCALVDAEIRSTTTMTGEVFNIGGGISNSISLVELTALCESIVGRHVKAHRRASTSPTDIRFYVTDVSKANRALHWHPQKDLAATISDVATWMSQNESQLKPLFLGRGSWAPLEGSQ